MANLVSLRDSLASDLSAAGRVVYAFPREQITQAALANIETLMLDVFSTLPTGTGIINGFSQPQIEEVSGNQMLTSSLTIELVTTN